MKNKKYLFFKRIIDITLSFFAIVLLMPFFIFFVPLNAIIMKGNPFYIQKRVGKDLKIFKMIKFRSMTNKKDKDGKLLPDEKRLTKFGLLIRKLSLDEIPQIFNIFKGEMSIIGPRPPVIDEVVFFDEKIIKRQDVRPGLTGLAQINGRNNISWDEKFDYDIKYINDISLKKDINIFFNTIRKVLEKSDINKDGFITFERYCDYLIRINKITKEEKDKKINIAVKIEKDNSIKTLKINEA